METSRFTFKDVSVDPKVQTRANLRLIEALAMGPLDTWARGAVERGNGYVTATIEVSSRFFHHVEKAAALTGDVALDRVLARLEDYFYDWRYSRARYRPRSGRDAVKTNAGASEAESPGDGGSRRAA